MASLLCSVCQEQARNQNEEWHVTQCGHTFHKPCLDAALQHHAKCPNCRELVSKRKGHFRLYLSDYAPPTPSSQLPYQEPPAASADTAEVEVLRKQLRALAASEDELRARFKALKTSKREVEARENVLLESYKEALAENDRIMDDHRKQLHEQGKLSKEKDKRQKSEFDQLQRKYEQLQKKFELLRLQKDKCLQREEIDQLVDRVRKIDGDGTKPSTWEAKLSNLLGERNKDYKNLMGQFQGLNGEKNEAVDKAARLEKELRAQKKAVKEMQETVDRLKDELAACQKITPGRRAGGLVGAAGRHRSPGRNNLIVYDTPAEEYEWRRPELASRPAYEVASEMGPPPGRRSARTSDRSRQAAQEKGARNGQPRRGLQGLQGDVGGNGAGFSQPWQQLDEWSTRNLVEDSIVLVESKLDVVPESGWGESHFQEGPAANAHDAEPADGGSRGGNEPAAEANCDKVDLSVLEIEDWSGEPGWYISRPAGGAGPAEAAQATGADAQADSDLMQISDEGEEPAAGESEGISGFRSAPGGPAGEHAAATRDQPPQSSLDSHHRTGKTWRELPLRERMVALKRTSELQNTPSPPASGSTLYSGLDIKGRSLAAGNTANALAPGPRSAQQQAGSAFKTGEAMQLPARSAKPQLLIPPAPQQQQAARTATALQHFGERRPDSHRATQKPAKRQLTRLYDEAPQGMADNADPPAQDDPDCLNDAQPSGSLKWSIHLSSDDDDAAIGEQPAHVNPASDFAAGPARRDAGIGQGRHLDAPSSSRQQADAQRRGLQGLHRPLVGLALQERFPEAQQLRSREEQAGTGTLGRSAADTSSEALGLEDEENLLEGMLLPGDMARSRGRGGFCSGGGEREKAKYVAEGADGRGGRTKVLLPSNRDLSFTSFDQRPASHPTSFAGKKRPGPMRATKTKRVKGKAESSTGLKMEHFFARK